MLLAAAGAASYLAALVAAFAVAGTLVGTAHETFSGSLVFRGCSLCTLCALVDNKDAVACACQGEAGRPLEVDAVRRQAALF